MSSRERKPSAKARELASTYLHDYDGPSSSNSAQKHKTKPKAKLSGGKSKRVYSQYDEDEDYTEPVTTTNDFEVPKAYCVCLGDDDSTPMIQCEGCENWFHFRCIDLQEEEAKRIKKYFCENCSLAGLGQTKYFGQGGSPSPVPEDARDAAYDSVGEPEPTSSDDDEDEENAPLQTSASKKRNSGPFGKRPRKRAKAEGTSDEDEEDDPAYVGELESMVHTSMVAEKPKRKPANARSAMDKRAKLEALANKRRGSSGTKVSTDPAAARTRQGVKTQLLRTLADIYILGEPSTGRLEVDDIEQELFNLTAEHDEKGLLAPRAKYSAKFRSLFQNLRSNTYLRTRIAGQSSEAAVTAHSLVNMTAEDLLTPEQRALAQQLQEKSMRDSIKSAIEAPKAKVTHKGEEIIEEMATNDARIDVRPRQSSLGGSAMGAQSPAAFLSSPMSPKMSPRERQMSFGTPREPEQAFSPREDTFMGPPPMPRSNSGPLITPEDVGGDSMDSPIEETKAVSVPTPASPNTSRTSFDIDSVWGTFKSPVLDQSPPPVEEGGQEDNDMEVGNSPPVAADPGDAEQMPKPSAAPASDPAADLEAILRNDAPTNATAGTASAIPIDRLAPIWDGALDSPDEVVFPAFAVQVAGRLLGTNRDYWHRLLPPNVLRVEGRLATQVAAEYLVQNTFSTSRELIVLALLPDLSGPTALKPDKPTAERARADYATLISTLSSRKRTAVVLPQERQKKAIKDIYIYALLRTDPVPDFIELLEAHALGEGKERDRDYLLVVAVIQKGVLPPPIFDMPSTAPISSLPRPPAGMPVPPAGFPPMPFGGGVPPHNMAGLDPNLVQALLAQPQLLQALAAGQPAPGMSPQPHLQQQVGNMLSGLDPSVLGALLKPQQQQSPPPHMGARSPPHAPQQHRQVPPPAPMGVSRQSPGPMGMSINPDRMRMLESGGPPMNARGGRGGSHRGGFDHRGRGSYR